MNANRTVKTADIAAALGISRDGVTKRAIAQGWKPVTRERGSSGTRYAVTDLPDDVQAALRAQGSHAIQGGEHDANAAQRDALWATFQSAEGYRKRIAEQRMDAMMMMERFRAEGMSLAGARDAVSEHYAAQGLRGVGVSSLKRWFRAVKGKPRSDWMAYLLPEKKAARSKEAIHPAAWAAFTRDYLRLEKPSAESCYRRLQYQVKANRDWGRLPSLKTVERRLRGDVSRAQIVLCREGEEALVTMGPKIARSRECLVALDRVNSDGHKFDVAVLFPDGSTARPIIVGWQDIASGKVLSWRIGRTESSDLVRLSFCDMVRDYGIPQHAYIDNGRAYASKANTGGLPTRYRYKVKPEDPQGIITRLGTAVHWVTPYNGKAKPIERMWRDFAQDISRRPEFAGAYLGNSPAAKPENYGSRAVPFAEFVRVVAAGIAEHNARQGRRGGVCNGRSFDDAFSTSYATATVQRATAQQLALLLLASDVVKVDGRSGEVRLAGNRYWAECLAPYMGQRIELRFDPDALHSVVHAVALDGTYIGSVPCIAGLGWGTSEQMRDAIRAQAEWKRRHKAERAAAARVKDAYAATAQPAPSIVPTQTPSPAVTRLFVTKSQPRTDAGFKPAPLNPVVLEMFRKGIKP